MVPHDRFPPPWPLDGSEMAHLIRAHDWAATPLGPVREWPANLRALVDLMLGSGTLMCLLWGHDAVMVYNDAYARSIGQRHPAALGRSAHDAWADVREGWLPLFEQAWSGKEAVARGQQLRFARPDMPRQEAWFDLTYTPVRNERGEVDGVLALVRDATGEVQAEQRRQSAEARLRESETRLQNVLNGMDEAFGLLDHDFRILAFNDAALRFETGTREEILGRRHWEVYPGSENSEAGRLLRRAMEERTAVTLDHLYTWESGPARWLEMRAYPVPEGLAVFWRDISGRKAAEAALRESGTGYRQLAEQFEKSQRLQSAMLEVVPVGLALLSNEGEVLLSNPAWDRFTPGRRMPSRDPDRGRRWRAWDKDGRQVMPGDFPGARALRGERCLPGTEFLYTDDNGDEIWTNAASVPLLDSQDQVTGAVSIIMDIDAGRRAEQILRAVAARQAFLLELGDALRAQTRTESLIEVAARLLGEHIGASRIMFAEIDEARGVADIFHGWFADGAQPFPAVMRLEDYEGPILQDLRAGRTVRIDDTRNPALARPDLAAIAELGVEALLSVPLLVDGRLLVNLSVHQHSPRCWTDEDVALVQEVAERLWADLVRFRAEAALRDSERRFRALLTTGGYMVYRMNADWTEMAELRGNGILADTEVPFPAWPDRYILPEDLPMIQARIEEAIRTRSLFELEHRVRQADGSVGWVLSRAVPIVGKDGGIIEWFGAATDVSARRRAEERLRDAEERHRTDLERQVAERTAELSKSRDLLQATMDSSTDMIQVFRAVRNAQGEIVDFRWVLNNHTSVRYYGKVEGESLLERNPGVVTVGIFDAFKRVTETGVPEQAERHYVHEQFDGWFLQSVVKLDDGVATTTKDITDWKNAQAEVPRLQEEVAQARLRESEDALRESEARFRQFGEASADVLWIRDCESLAFEYVSPAFERIYGTRIEDVLKGNHLRRWLEMILPEDREKVLDVFHRVRRGEQVVHSFRILRGDGQLRWIRDTDFPLFDAAGKVQRIGGIAHDATEEVELQDRLQVLVAELQHRSRNLVGVVKGITERTLATSDTLERFRGRFRPRLDALARVNGLLSRLEEGDRITFDQLLQAELAAHGILDGETNGTAVHLHGPKGIRLRSATVQTFALALHELTTNALKYGALSQPEGKLEVTWSLIPGSGTERRLRVDWRETGVLLDLPVAAATSRWAPPRRQGYGRELIERALPYQLKAETSYELTPGGVRCTIIVPVSSTLDVAFSSQGDPDA